MVKKSTTNLFIRILFLFENLFNFLRLLFSKINDTFTADGTEFFLFPEVTWFPSFQSMDWECVNFSSDCFS